MKKLTFILSFILILGLNQKAFSQGFDFTSQKSKDPIEITSDNGIEWHQKQKMLMAKKNVLVKKADVRLTCDEIKAYYKEDKNGDTQIYYIQAKGNIKINSKKEKAKGNYIDYDLDKGLMVLKGKPATISTATEKITAKDKIEYWQKEKKAVARGNVVAKQKQRTIKSEILTAYFKEGEGKAFELEKVEAFKNVTIRSKNGEIRGDKGIYDTSSSLAILRGNVVISQGENSLKGEYAQMDMTTGISKLKSDNNKKQKVKGVFIPNKLKE